MYAELTGPQGYIKRPETNAAECLQAILDTTDKPDTVNEVFEWLTGLDTFLWRFEQDIQQIERVRTVELGTGNNNAFIISAIGSCNERRAALAVHPAK